MIATYELLQSIPDYYAFARECTSNKKLRIVFDKSEVRLALKINNIIPMYIYSESSQGALEFKTGLKEIYEKI